MNDSLKVIDKALKKAGIRYAILDSEEKSCRILISPDQKNDLIKAASGSGWKKLKDKSKDIYLYGMDHFLYFTVNDVKLTVCFQLACRSTLNGEWVPLDRKINNFAMDRIVMAEGADTYEPMPEDFLCYLLAKCVYTEKGFSEEDKRRITKCSKKVDTNVLMPKIEGVFFHFSETMLKMIDEGDFEHIIEALWRYAEY